MGVRRRGRGGGGGSMGSNDPPPPPLPKAWSTYTFTLESLKSMRIYIRVRKIKVINNFAYARLIIVVVKFKRIDYTKDRSLVNEIKYIKSSFFYNF